MADKISYKSWQCPPAATGESDRISWLDDATGDGLAWLKSQRTFRDFRKALDTISGIDTQPNLQRFLPQQNQHQPPETQHPRSSFSDEQVAPVLGLSLG
jgi:hypothetical protein